MKSSLLGNHHPGDTGRVYLESDEVFEDQPGPTVESYNSYEIAPGPPLVLDMQGTRSESSSPTAAAGGDAHSGLVDTSACTAYGDIERPSTDLESLWKSM